LQERGPAIVRRGEHVEAADEAWCASCLMVRFPDVFVRPVGRRASQGAVGDGGDAGRGAHGEEHCFDKEHAQNGRPRAQGTCSARLAAGAGLTHHQDFHPTVKAGAPPPLETQKSASSLSSSPPPAGSVSPRQTSGGMPVAGKAVGISVICLTVSVISWDEAGSVAAQREPRSRAVESCSGGSGGPED
jgi:hypothetical protein